MKTIYTRWLLLFLFVIFASCAKDSGVSMNTHELGKKLVVELRQYYSGIYKVRSLGLENVKSDDAQKIIEARKRIKRLIDAQADLNYIDEEGVCALYVSAINNDKIILEDLINAGARLDAKTPEGFSILRASIAVGALDSAYILLANKADPDGLIQEDPRPLSLALLKSVFDSTYSRLALRLIELGASVDVRSDDNSILLVRSIKLKNTLVSLALVKVGADLGFVDKDGISVVDWAIIMKENAVLEAIMNKHALSGEEAKRALAFALMSSNKEAYRFLASKGFRLQDDKKLFSSLRLRQTLPKSTQTAQKPIKAEPMKDLISLKFVSVTQKDNVLVIKTQDPIRKEFSLKKPYRLVFDFVRMDGVRNLNKKFNNKYLKRIQIGRNKTYYRVVFHLQGGFKYSINKDGGLITVVLRAN